MNRLESWFECIVPNGNLWILTPTNNGDMAFVRYPFVYGNVVCVQY